MPAPGPDELARIDQVCDAVVARIQDAWNPSAPDEVRAPDDFELESSKIEGRRVEVFGDTYLGNPVTRGQDFNDYTLVVLVSEKFPDEGEVDRAWRRRLTRFCEWLLNDVIADPRGPRLLPTEGDPNSGLWPQSAEVVTVYDTEELSQKKLFFCVMRVTYREHAG
jgi:hypothetical protein